MFGQNPVSKEVEGDGLSLHLVGGSPFYTIQGEGPFAGEPAIFVRLHGCPLRCYFCDTNFSDPKDPVVPIDALLEQIAKAAPLHCRLVVLTGGEPTRQPLGPLINQLVELQYTVQVETAGVFWQDCLSLVGGGVYTVVSPKTPKVDEGIRRIACAYKYIVSASSPLDPDDGIPTGSTQVPDRKAQLARPRAACPIYLSPMDEYDETKNAANRKLVGELCMKYGYKAGLQIHKFLGLP